MDSSAVATAFETGELHDACDLTRDAIAIGREVSDLDDPKLPADYETDDLLAHARTLCGHLKAAYRFPAPNPVVDEWHQRLATLENKLKTLGGTAAADRTHPQRRNRRK